MRRRTAAILAEELGWPVESDHICPAQGSNRQLDVYRWEVFTQDGNGLTHVLGCWETLTEFVKQAPKIGFYVSDGVIYMGKPATHSS